MSIDKPPVCPACFSARCSVQPGCDHPFHGLAKVAENIQGVAAEKRLRDKIQQFESAQAQNRPSYVIQTYIEIDAAHRVPMHESKCRNLHGHRYRITARVEAAQLGDGAQDGMVLDFGFVKKLMKDYIDTNCDHGVILSIHDTDMLALSIGANLLLSEWQSYAEMKDAISGRWKCWTGKTAFGKTLVIPYVPTAENLARFWFEMLEDRIVSLSQGRANLTAITVRETPTSEATFPIRF